MLSLNDLININKIPEESDISLKLLLDFYEQHLGGKVYKFTLGNDDVVKLIFKDTSQVFHLIGANHMYDKKFMDGTKFATEIRADNITLESLKKSFPKQYKDYVDRIRSVFCTDSLLKKCECLKFNSGQIPESKIKVKYLIIRAFGDVNLHLGIDTHKGQPYYPKTLILASGNTREKYIDKADEKISIKKLEIIDIHKKQVLELVDRDKAKQIAAQEVLKLADDWMNKEVNVPNKEKKNISFHFLKSQLNSYLSSQKSVIEIKVKPLDPYLTGKIVAEAIRCFVKEQFKDRFFAYTEKFETAYQIDFKTLQRQGKEKKDRESHSELEQKCTIRNKKIGIDDD